MAKTDVKTSVVDNALIVSFNSGKEPKVWRMDMGRFLSTAFEVKENQGKFTLVIKPGNGSAEEVGTFDNRKHAVEALESITGALMQGKGASVTQKTEGVFMKFVKFILKLVLAVFVFLTVIVVLFKPQHPPGNVGDTVSPPVQSGVPVPADKALGGQ
jgi:hypothetical protein